jgi:predicted RNA binding protein YcfA (HicA-like mRNA interferase family)
VTALPVLSGRELVRRLQRFGYAVDRQSGSHIILRRSAARLRRLTVPNHREPAKGALRATLRHARLSPADLADDG